MILRVQTHFGNWYYVNATINRDIEAVLKQARDEGFELKFRAMVNRDTETFFTKTQ